MVALWFNVKQLMVVDSESAIKDVQTIDHSLMAVFSVLVAETITGNCVCAYYIV